MSKKYNDIVVSVHICAYNQEKWIRQAIESVLAQKTEYPFELVIGEDHGTDGTRAICQEYAKKYDNVILLPSEKNVGVVANWANCIRNGKGKYIMGCAGDDWWHNPNKIQMQVDFMEAHPECFISHTEFDVYYENIGETTRNQNEVTGIKPFEGKIQSEVLHGRDGITALTSCIRRDAFEKYIPVDDFINLHFPREDWPTYFILSSYGDVMYIPISTATYRVGQESITRSSNYDKIIKRAQQDLVMIKYLYSLFPDLGPFNDGPYFESIGYHNALLAAYRNDDYKSAHKFAKNDKLGRLATTMAHTWVTFKLFRWIQQKRRKL